MIIDRQFGDYVLLRRLAIGGQSEVFLAVKVGPDEYTRPVVIKALPSRYRSDEDFLRLFHKEAFISSRFAHPHVINVHDARVIEGDHCMVMDFVSGQTVLDVAQRGYQAGEPPKLPHVIRIIADACDGLDYVHEFRDLDDQEYRVVHRDVSPQNLMVTYQGVTRVFDFGIAKIEGYDQDEDMLAGGKYAYMSPEQCRGEAVDGRSDIFSLGIILYELSTGYRLFRRQTEAEIIDAVTSEPIRPPSELRDDLPPFLEQCVMRALERDPDKRYQRAGEMRDDLQKYLPMIARGNPRAELGDYVERLFEVERAEIAEILGQARQREFNKSKPLEGTPLEKVGQDEFEPVEDVTREIEVPMPPPRSADDGSLSFEEQAEADAALEEAMTTAAREREEREREHVRAEQARARAAELEDRIGQLETRQWVMAALLLVAIFAAVFLGVRSMEAVPTTEKAEAASRP